MKIASVAFDLDGTLVDSAGGVAHALNAALREHGVPAAALDQVRRWIGDGPDVLIDRAMAANGLGSDRALARELRRVFDAATLRDPMADSHVFDGIAELLDSLRGRPLVVVTNKPSPLARAVLDACGLLPAFAHVMGADTADLRKPAPGMLTNASRLLRIAPAELLMVGDSAADAGAARAAGCPVAWVTWGYGDPSHLGDKHNDDDRLWRIDTPAGLASRLSARSTID